jgi:hypothetical protein
VRRPSATALPRDLDGHRGERLGEGVDALHQAPAVARVQVTVEGVAERRVAAVRVEGRRDIGETVGDEGGERSVAVLGERRLQEVERDVRPGEVRCEV